MFSFALLSKFAILKIIKIFFKREQFAFNKIQIFILYLTFFSLNKKNQILEPLYFMIINTLLSKFVTATVKISNQQAQILELVDICYKEN